MKRVAIEPGLLQVFRLFVAVRLALRTAAMDPAMDKLLAEMRSEDGRGKW